MDEERRTPPPVEVVASTLAAKDALPDRAVVEATLDGFWMMGHDGRCVDANQAFADMLGYARHELVGLSVGDIDAVETPEVTANRMETVRRVGSARFETRHRRKDGSVVDVEVSAVYLPDRHRFIVFSRDITERVRLTEALERTAAELRGQRDFFEQVFLQSSVSTQILDRDGWCLRINPKLGEIFGVRPEHIEGRVYNIFADAEIQRTGVAAHLERVFREGQTAEWEVFFDIGHAADSQGITVADRVQRWFRNWAYPIFDPERRLSHVIIQHSDITERKRAAEALAASEERFRTMAEQSADVISVTDDEGRLVYASPSAAKVFGLPPAEMIGRHFTEFLDPTAVPVAVALFRQTVAHRAPTRNAELLMRRADGSTLVAELNGSPLTSTLGHGTLVVIRDITDRKRAEEERAALTAQLQQAMKMEAVGRLAGGIAHDFNNLLTSILGTAHLAQLDLRPGDPTHEAFATIGRAAESAASLTQQLLAFSRKQLIEPRVVDLSDLVARMLPLLRRLIGEDIALRTGAGSQLGSVRIDPSQFEQVLVNLAVNARDAMPGGGQLLIETANAEFDDDYCRRHPLVKPGHYVMLAVSDTGHGMSPEVRLRIFEPFFTTKPKGRGTGLGLSTIYGVAQQAGGGVDVYSEEGRGTTFRVYLPRVEEPAGPLETGARGDEMPGGTETILLVEDEDLVRTLAVRTLERLGYRVLSAPNGARALELAAGSAGRIDLLMTDVVMPGLNGRELAERMLERQPGLRILYTSGYTEDAIAHHGVIDQGLHFIAKPYVPRTLARKIREVLEREL